MAYHREADRMVVFDNVNKTTTVIVLADTSDGIDVRQAFEAASQAVDDIVDGDAEDARVQHLPEPDRDPG